MHDKYDAYATALLALKSGDPITRNDAIGTLMALIVPEARWVAAKFHEHHLDADDLIQAAQIRILALAEQFEYDPKRSAAALVVCVARRASISAAKSLARQRPLGTWSLDLDLFRGGSGYKHHTVSEVLEDPNAVLPVDGFADAHDARIALRILRTELSAMERAVWIARHIYEQSYEEIAQSFSVGRKKPLTFKAVDNSLTRAHGKLSRFRRVNRICEEECRKKKWTLEHSENEHERQ